MVNCSYTCDTTRWLGRKFYSSNRSVQVLNLRFDVKFHLSKQETLLNDHQWHGVLIRKNGRTLKMKVERFGDVKLVRQSTNLALKKISVGGARRMAAARLKIVSLCYLAVKTTY